MKVVNVEETLKALEQKEINRKRKEVDVHAVKEETKSDNENEVNIFACFVNSFSGCAGGWKSFAVFRKM